ncbi:MAG: sigma-70 family RNA polymerase sigma factor [Myxococcaceae bacterium]|nr:sigma-70 family RNA polymerase sigma factor [Myxococcaceae bacterium]MCA3016389.1 sigma-70 family RNA polymerase sigma factor [Myxococcaceae bacterium]
MSLELHTLYEAEVDAVHAFLGKLGLRGADLEDCVHDVFVTAIKRRSSFDASRPVRPWLFGIAFRVMTARLRRSSSRTEVFDGAPEPVDGSHDPERSLEEKQRRQLLQRAVAELSEEQATVFVMHDLQGVGAAAISEAMGTPLATTYSRLRLARQRFSDVIRRLREQEAA